MLKTPIKTKFDKKEKAAVRASLALVKERLPAKAKILILSLSGSRAFGWAADNLDYDIHGIFVYNHVYWDWVHIGIPPYDITMHELNHCFQSIEYQPFEFFSSMTNPFYIDHKFDYKGMMRLAPRNIDKTSLITEMKKLEARPCARSALHVYRLVLTSLNLMDRNRFEVDVLKIAPRYRSKMPALLKEMYNFNRIMDFDIEKKTKKELNHLFKLHEKKASRFEKNKQEKQKEDKIRIRRWIEKMALKFGKSNPHLPHFV